MGNISKTGFLAEYMEKKPYEFTTVDYQLAGMQITVAGLAAPKHLYKRDSGGNLQAVGTYLTNRWFHTLIALDTERTIDQPSPNLKVILKPVTDFEELHCPLLDEIFLSVRDAAFQGQKVAIHCTAGIGRTGVVLVSLELRGQMLDLSNDELQQVKQEQADERIAMGEYSIGEDYDDGYYPAFVTKTVKSAMCRVRSITGRLDVESQEQVGSLCAYQKFLAQQILNARKTLVKSYDELKQEVEALESALKVGVLPDEKLFLDAYQDGNFDMMKILIKSGFVPTEAMRESSVKYVHPEADAFFSMNVLVGQFRVHLNQLNQVIMNDKNHEMLEEVQAFSKNLNEYMTNWSNEDKPPQEMFDALLVQLKSIAQNSKFATEAYYANSMPAIAEFMSGVNVFSKILTLVGKSLYGRVYTDNTLSQSIFKQPTPGDVQSTNRMKEASQNLREPEPQAKPRHTGGSELK
ncbi:MAG: hypothetical protein K0U37_02130 [Gammaproteobacteria bacterium]|nr:hypothetical protein [Gammaproteobacteria bacterium]